MTVAVAAGLKPDPKVRAVREGGRVVAVKCALPSCGKLRRITKQSMKYAGVEVTLDPFCSTECCREFHGCELESIDEGKSKGGKAGQEKRRRARGIPTDGHPWRARGGLPDGVPTEEDLLEELLAS